MPRGWHIRYVISYLHITAGSISNVYIIPHKFDDKVINTLHIITLFAIYNYFQGHPAPQLFKLCNTQNVQYQWWYGFLFLNSMSIKHLSHPVFSKLIEMEKSQQIRKSNCHYSTLLNNIFIMFSIRLLR